MNGHGFGTMNWSYFSTIFNSDIKGVWLCLFSDCSGIVFRDSPGGFSSVWRTDSKPSCAAPAASADRTCPLDMYRIRADAVCAAVAASPCSSTMRMRRMRTMSSRRSSCSPIWRPPCDAAAAVAAPRSMPISEQTSMAAAPAAAVAVAVSEGRGRCTTANVMLAQGSQRRAAATMSTGVAVVRSLCGSTICACPYFVAVAAPRCQWCCWSRWRRTTSAPDAQRPIRGWPSGMMNTSRSMNCARPLPVQLLPLPLLLCRQLRHRMHHELGHRLTSGQTDGSAAERSPCCARSEALASCSSSAPAPKAICWCCLPHCCCCCCGAPAAVRPQSRHVACPYLGAFTCTLTI